MKFVGQEKLLAELDKYNIENLPKTMLFEGEQGCGKHTVIKMLAKRLNLDIVTISESVEQDQLVEYSQCPLKKIYIIELAKFTDKQQNQFLKFIEEPSKTVNVVLILDAGAFVLPTILNRCIRFKFEEYTIEQLKEFDWQISGNVDHELVYKICKTPGKLQNISATSVASLKELCTKIVTGFNKSRYPNAMSILTKVNYKENYDRYDFEMFFNMLEYVAFETYINSGSTLSFKVYLFTNTYKQNKLNKSVARENFMLNFLSNLWQEVNNETD